MAVPNSTESQPTEFSSSKSGSGPGLTRFLVDSEWSPDVLARVVMLLHRLNVEIVALTMRRVRKGMRITVDLAVGEERCERIAAQLGKVVQVRSVVFRDGKEQDGKATRALSER